MGAGMLESAAWGVGDGFTCLVGKTSAGVSFLGGMDPVKSKLMTRTAQQKSDRTRPIKTLKFFGIPAIYLGTCLVLAGFAFERVRKRTQDLISKSISLREILQSCSYLFMIDTIIN